MGSVRKTVTMKWTATAVQYRLKIKLFYEGNPMKGLKSCEFNIDSECVEICFFDESKLAIDCVSVENGIETTVNGRSELDWLIYNAPLDYAKFVLGGELDGYLKRVSGPYSGIDWES